jgi:hypothetical protein
VRTRPHGFGDLPPRFLPDDILPLFTRRAAATPEAVADALAPQPMVGVDIGARLRGMWG